MYHVCSLSIYATVRFFSWFVGQIGVFGQMVLNGHIYRGRKPVHWSPSSGTALAEAELEYPEGHTSRSIYVVFKMTGLGEKFPEELKPFLPDMGVAIWTTTPWTIPANAGN
jgi:isoleucyl-tRNA synthetase